MPSPPARASQRQEAANLDYAAARSARPARGRRRPTNLTSHKIPLPPGEGRVTGAVLADARDTNKQANNPSSTNAPKTPRRIRTNDRQLSQHNGTKRAGRRHRRRAGRRDAFRRLIAQQGFDVQLFEREHFPRFHIGESLIPETYWVLKRLNMLDKMKTQPLRQEVQRAVRQRQRQAVRAVLLRRPQAARMLADLAGRAQRVRPDDARQRPRARRRGARRRCACWKCCSTAIGAVGVRVHGRRRAANARCGPRSSSTPAARARMIANRFKLRVMDPDAEEGGRLDLLGRGLSRHGPRRRGHDRPADQGKEGLVLVHPAAQQHRQRRRRRRRSITLFKDRARPRDDLQRRSRPLPGGQRARGHRPPRRPASSPPRIIRIAPAGRRRRLGAGRRRLRLSRSALFLRRAAGAEVGPAGGRRHRRRAGQGRHLGRAARQVGRRRSTRAWTACAGWCANTTTASASAAS